MVRPLARTLPKPEYQLPQNNTPSQRLNCTLASQAHSGATAAPGGPMEVKLYPFFRNTLMLFLGKKKVEMRATVRSNFHQIPEALAGVRHRIRIQRVRAPCEFGLEMNPIRTERARK